MARALKLDVNDTQLLVIDLQVKLLPFIQGNEEVVATCSRIIRAADVFGLPITVTEQYPQGIGRTHQTILDTLEKVQHSKFESHVCVQQTTLDLLNLDFEVFVLADGVSSRMDFDYDISLLRMQQAGAVVTTSESVMFELCELSGTEPFKKILEIVKETT